MPVDMGWPAASTVWRDVFLIHRTRSAMDRGPFSDRDGLGIFGSFRKGTPCNKIRTRSNSSYKNNNLEE